MDQRKIEISDVKIKKHSIRFEGAKEDTEIHKNTEDQFRENVISSMYASSKDGELTNRTEAFKEYKLDLDSKKSYVSLHDKHVLVITKQEKSYSLDVYPVSRSNGEPVLKVDQKKTFEVKSKFLFEFVFSPCGEWLTIRGKSLQNSNTITVIKLNGEQESMPNEVNLNEKQIISNAHICYYYGHKKIDPSYHLMNDILGLVFIYSVQGSESIIYKYIDVSGYNTTDSIIVYDIILDTDNDIVKNMKISDMTIYNQSCVVISYQDESMRIEFDMMIIEKNHDTRKAICRVVEYLKETPETIKDGLGQAGETRLDGSNALTGGGYFKSRVVRHSPTDGSTKGFSLHMSANSKVQYVLLDADSQEVEVLSTIDYREYISTFKYTSKYSRYRLSDDNSTIMEKTDEGVRLRKTHLSTSHSGSNVQHIFSSIPTRKEKSPIGMSVLNEGTSVVKVNNILNIVSVDSDLRMDIRHIDINSILPSYSDHHHTIFDTFTHDGVPYTLLSTDEGGVYRLHVIDINTNMLYKSIDVPMKYSLTDLHFDRSIGSIYTVHDGILSCYDLLSGATVDSSMHGTDRSEDWKYKHCGNEVRTVIRYAQNSSSDVYLHTADGNDTSIDHVSFDSKYNVNIGASVCFYIRIHSVLMIFNPHSCRLTVLRLNETDSPPSVVQTDCSEMTADSISMDGSYVSFVSKSQLILVDTQSLVVHRIDVQRESTHSHVVYSADHRFASFVCTHSTTSKVAYACRLSPFFIVRQYTVPHINTAIQMFTRMSFDSISFIHASHSFISVKNYSIKKDDNEMMEAIMYNIRKMNQASVSTVRANHARTVEFIVCGLMSPFSLVENRSICSIVYHVDDYSLMVSYMKMIHPHILFNLFDILDIVKRSPAPCSHSIRGISDYLVSYVKEKGHYPLIEQEVLARFVTPEEGSKGITRQSDIKNLGLLLIFAPLGSPIKCEIDGRYEDAPVRSITVEGEKVTHQTIFEEVKKMMGSGGNIKTYQMHYSLMDLDLENGSTPSQNFFEGIRMFPSKDMKNVFKPIIYYKWSLLFWYAAFLALIHFSAAILCMIFYGNPTDNHTVGYVALSLLCTIVVYEVKTMISKGMRYFENKMNLFDMLTLILNIVMIVIVTLTDDTTRLESVAMNWIILTAMVLIWVKASTYLRVIGPIRRLLTMMYEVFFDLIPFLIILLCALIIFSFAWRIVHTLGQSSIHDYKPFSLAFFESSSLVFAGELSREVDDDGNEVELKTVRFVVGIVGQIVLSLILSNFIISVIGGTYERITDESDIHDIRGLLVMIEDFDSFLYGMKCRGKKKGGMRYIILLPTEEEESDGVGGKIDGLEQKVKQTRDALEESLREEMRMSREVNEKRIKGVEERIREDVRGVEKSVNETNVMMMRLLEDKYYLSRRSFDGNK